MSTSSVMANARRVAIDMKKMEHLAFKVIEDVEKKKFWNQVGPIDVQKFYRTLKVAHPFVFDGAVARDKMEEVDKDVDIGKLAEDFSLPFTKTLYLINNPPSTRSSTGGVQDGRMVIHGLLIDEITPEKFELTLIADRIYDADPTRTVIPCVVSETLDLNEVDPNDGIARYLFLLTNAISVKRIGIETGGIHTFKNKSTTSGFTVVKHDNIIHIADKVEYHYSVGLTGERVEYIYAGWWRAHWRAFYLKDAAGNNLKDARGRNRVDYLRLGKNRMGNRVIMGYTWVKEHCRGDPRLAEIVARMVVKQR